MKVTFVKQGKGSLSGPGQASTLIIGFPAFKTVRNKWLLFKTLIYGVLIYGGIATQID